MGKKKKPTQKLEGFPSGSDGKESAYDAGDSGSIPGSGRSLGEGNDNPLQYLPGGGAGGGEGNDTPLQYSCPENPMNGGAW